MKHRAYTIFEDKTNYKELLKNCWQWIKEHVKELALVAGLSLASIAAIIFCCKNAEEILKVWNELKGALAKSRDVTQPAPLHPEKADPSSFPAQNIEDSLPDDVVAGTDGFESIKSYNVGQYIRTLPAGQRASKEKLAEAESKGIPLFPGQTIVDAHERTRKTFN